MRTLRFASVLLLAVALRPDAHAQPPLSFPPVQTFADVGFSARWYGTTDLLRERNITTGCQAYPQALYCPDWNAGRAMISILVIRSICSALTGNPEGFSHPTSPYFQDVDPGHWAFKYIQQMKALGITAGCGDGTVFCPDDPASNFMAAVFAVRARYVRDNGGAAVPPGWLPPYASYPQRFWDVSFGDPIFPWVQSAYDLVGPEIRRPEYGGNFYPELAIPRGPLSFYLIYGILGSPALPPNSQGGTPAYSIAPVTNGPNCGLTAGPYYFNLVAQLSSDSYPKFRALFGTDWLFYGFWESRPRVFNRCDWGGRNVVTNMDLLHARWIVRLTASVIALFSFISPPSVAQ